MQTKWRALSILLLQGATVIDDKLPIRMWMYCYQVPAALQSNSSDTAQVKYKQNSSLGCTLLGNSKEKK